jgi:hypothetical protein
MKNAGRRSHFLLAVAVHLVLLLSLTSAQTTTGSGEFIVEPPTLLSLGFEWKISGDDNRNARVDVSYRRKGEPQWRKGLPLLRIQHEQINGGADLFVSVESTPDNPNGVAPNPWHYDTGNMFAGSILNLEPDTEYECGFTLSDPDGVTGAAEKTATVRTRKEPQPAAGGHTYHVYPIGWEGPKQEPAFTGLGNAYFMGQRHSDHQNVFPPRVQPGDIILVHAGLYVADRFHNDMYNMGDNCIESDGGAHNIRVFRNRCVNSAQGALSAQPMFGGPVYFYQNLVYNTPGGGGVLKYADTPAGVLTYQNTFIGEANMGGASSNVHHLNNLFLGAQASAAIFALSTYTNYSTSDYNGFRPNPKAADSFVWNSPPFDVKADYDYKKKLTTRRFKTLAEYSKATGQETHSVLLDYDIFVHVKMPDESDPQHLYNPEDYDFRLKAGSAAIDAGTLIPTINDDFTGRAPDLGAFEFGKPLPHYGPRSDVSGAVPSDNTAFRSWTGPLHPQGPGK